MRMRFIVIGGIVAVVGVVLLARSLLREPRDHQQVLSELIERAAHAAEERDVKQLRSWLADDYRDPDGRDRQQIGRMLTLLLLRGGVVSVYIMDKAVQVHRGAEPLTARALVTVILTRGPRMEKLTDILPDAARAIRLDLAFRLVDDDWKVASASWEKLRSVRQLLEQ